MSRVKNPTRLKSDQNGSRRRQVIKPVFRSGSTNKTKKRRRDGKSPEKD